MDVLTFLPGRRELASKGYVQDAGDALTGAAYTLPESGGARIHSLPWRRIHWYYDIQRTIEEIRSPGEVDVFDIHLMHYALPLSNRRNIVLSLHYWDPVCPYVFFPQSHKSNYFLFDSNGESSCFGQCADCVGKFQYLKWRLFKRQAVERISRYIVKRPRDRVMLLRVGIENRKIELVPFWVDTDAILRGSQRRGTRADSSPVFAFVGRLDAPKGALLCLQAFSRVAAKEPSARLLFMGDGALKPSLVSFAEEQGLSKRVSFLGHIPRSEIFNHFHKVDVFVHTQWYSNYGWALLECMSTQKPIVATNVGDTGDILEDGVNALLAEPTPESVSQSMLELIANPGLGQLIAGNALETVRRNHDLKNLQRYEEVLEEVAAEWSHRSRYPC